MRHTYNKDNEKHKQERSQSDDVDESELVDEMPGRTVSDGGAHGRKNNAGSALSHDGGSARSPDVEDRIKVDEAGSALVHDRGSALWHELSSTYEESIATGDALVGLCFPHRVRQMLCSYLDQATQTSLFV